MGDLRISPGAVLPRDMNAVDWSKFLGSARTRYYRDGQTEYDTGTGFWLGLDTDGIPKFSLGNSAANKLTWDGSTLNIVGNVTATTGTIGGWTLAATYLESGSGANTVRLDSGGTNPAISAGSATPASAPFRVTQAGALVATSATITGAITATSGSFTGTITSTAGTIGGWTLGATSLLAGSGATTVAMDSGGTNPAFYAGSATPGSAPFRVTQAGALFASSATIDGDLTAGRSAYKTSSTSRSSTTTFADDPDLTFPLSVGTHLIELLIIMTESVSSSCGVKSQINFTGSGNLRGITGLRAHDPGTDELSYQSALASGVGINEEFLAANVPVHYDLKLMYTVATAGTFSIQWAQSVSNANLARMVSGSYIKASRLL